MSQFRVSPPRVFPAATRSSRPPADAAGSADAHRQAGFILGNDIDLLLQGLQIESEIARQAGTSRYRNHTVASTMAMWSRSWLCRLEALHALEWGNYAASAALVESGARLMVAAHVLVDTSAADWTAWLDSGGLAPAHDEHATQVRINDTSSRSPSGPGPIDEVARAAAILAGPSFAASVLLSAPESTPARVAAVFGDRDFSVALAELNLGWLLVLTDAWIAILDAGTIFPAPEPQVLERWRTSVRRELARRDRCRLDQAEVDGRPHDVLTNWRRSPGGAPRRILL